MGEVFAALDETLKRRVAVKVVRSDFRLDARAKARFLREAQILSHLDHPNICRVFNYVEGAERDWLVLELIEGHSLRSATAGSLSFTQRLAIATQIAEVLVATHAAGIVHRDLKPGNVMITPAGDVKVLDFGLARSLPAGGGHEPEDDEAGRGHQAGDPLGEAATVAPRGFPEEAPDPGPPATSPSAIETERGALLGTLAYMSPEQARGERATAASDLYSFGLLLQELFTGKPPVALDSKPAVLLERARRGDTSPPKGFDKDLARLVQRLKAIVPSERPTAVDTLERLRWIAAKPRRRLRRLAVAAAIVLAALTGTKYFVDLERERSAAVAARYEADGRRAQAESLVGFMIGDLRKKLETVGRLEILDEVGARAIEYFAAVPESALTDDELARRSAALYQIGDVRIAQGRLAEARAPLGQSLTLAKELAVRHPRDGERLFQLAQSHFWVGFVEWRQRRLDEALGHFREYLRIAERLVDLDPTRKDWRLELSSANSNIGSVLEEQGHPDAALERFEACLAIETALLVEHPDDTTLRGAVAASHNAIGAVLRTLGQLDESLAHHRQELAFHEELVRREPGTVQWQQFLGVSHNRVAMLLEATGAPDQAAAHAARALAIAERLSAEDRSNLDWLRELGRSHQRAGTTAAARGKGAEALAHLRTAVATLQRLARLDPLNPSRRRDLADARAALAAHLLDAGQAERARHEANLVEEIAGALLAQAADDLHAVRLRGLGLVLQGRAWRAEGSRARVEEAFGRAVEVLEPVARASRDYLVLEPFALALAGLGRSGEARGVVRQMAAMGYRNPGLATAVGGSGAAMVPPGR